VFEQKFEKFEKKNLNTKCAVEKRILAMDAEEVGIFFPDALHDGFTFTEQAITS
jgi:hypothetical protein